MKNANASHSEPELLSSRLMHDAPDEELMLRYAAGDAEAFRLLYERHKAPLFRYVTRQISNRAAAEEVFQDIWGNLVGSRQRYQVRAKFATWLYRVAHNRVVDWYRAQGRNQETSLDTLVEDDALAEPAGHEPGPARQLAARRATEQLSEALAALPDNQREAFLLQEESGLSLEEIAQVTGVGRETVKSRLRYAVAKLRAAITWAGPEEP